MGKMQLLLQDQPLKSTKTILVLNYLCSRIVTTEVQIPTCTNDWNRQPLSWGDTGQLLYNYSRRLSTIPSKRIKLSLLTDLTTTDFKSSHFNIQYDFFLVFQPYLLEEQRSQITQGESRGNNLSRKCVRSSALHHSPGPSPGALHTLPSVPKLVRIYYQQSKRKFFQQCKQIFQERYRKFSSSSKNSLEGCLDTHLSASPAGLSGLEDLCVDTGE